MKTYTKTARCPKCGEREITTHYSKGRGGALVSQSHLVRVCTYCNYSWAEKPLDEQADERPEVM